MMNFNIATNIHRFSIQSILLLICFVLPTSVLNADVKPIIGWLEFVQITGSGLRVEAKIDTGADSSSINARILKKYTRNGEEWVRFRIDNKKGKELVLDQKIIRYVKIKRRRMVPIKRPVINLGICLGHIKRVVEVNLAERSNFEYKMLIGRDYLYNTYLVDSAMTFTTSPGCE